MRWTLRRGESVPEREQTLLRFWASGSRTFAVYLRYLPNFSGALAIQVNGVEAAEQTINSAESQHRLFCVGKPGINTVTLNYRVEQLRELGREDQRLLLQEALFALDGTLNVGVFAEQLLVGDGWYAPERWDNADVRWSAQESQLELLTCELPTTLRFRAYAAPNEPRTVQLNLNGSALETVTLESGWHEYTVQVPTGAYRAGEKQVLTLSHNAAVVPENETRSVAAAYEWFRLE